MILGGDGKKLSKSHHAAAVGELRELGWSAGDVWRTVLPWLGIPPLAAATDGPALLHVAIDQAANVWPLVPPNHNNAQMLDPEVDAMRASIAPTPDEDPRHAIPA